MKKKWWTRILAASLAGMLAVPMSGLSALHAKAAPEQQASGDQTLKLWYDEPATITGLNADNGKRDLGFEEESLPLGCGYMGVNVWGGTDTEVVYVTENSLVNVCQWAPNRQGGLNMLAKTWIDFGHSFDQVKNYSRDLVLDDATAHVNYDYNGVHYSREYFTSYPDKVMAIKLSADQTGKVNFTLRPEAPFLCDYYNEEGDGKGKTGKVTAFADGTIVLSGTMQYYQTNYEAQYKVIPVGGIMTATNDGEYGGQIEVQGADSALILMAVGTNYELKPEVFTAALKDKLDPDSYPHEKVTTYLNAAAAKSYEELRKCHVEDYQTYYSRVNLDIGGSLSADKTTDVLLDEYKNGTHDPYLEELLFQYGRYLLIASSREGCLPANLQGIWNGSDEPKWSAGYWHNINQQMNYWLAFVTNMPELFKSYADFNEAFRTKAQSEADWYLTQIKSPLKETNGQNGWIVGTGAWPYSVSGPTVGGHSGSGTGAFTSMLFWDWYDFTRDQDILKEHTYPAIYGMADFLSKCLIEQDGLYLISPSASPENAENKQTVGCAFDQQMVWESYLELLEAAELLDEQDDSLVVKAKEQMDKLDPVNIGYSGQVKEYREENYYGEFGEKQHRHISQLVGLYPGTSITQDTEAWMDAAKVSLQNRGLGTTGWSIAHRLCAWARTGDGNMCYQELQHLLKTKITQNLWDTHPPFQIDGNFGATAGVGEMLLQSHAGYIAPLVSLPDAWADGSYKGLLARGNFVVDAAWQNGTATSLKITSQSGGSCSVKYPGLAGAVVKNGETVVATADSDLVTFDTVKGQTYTITGMQAVEEVAAPTNLTVTDTEDGIKLQWNASEDAVSYRVYQAVNDAAQYELVAADVNTEAYVYSKEEMSAHNLSASDRVTLRVTAVSADGRESEGTIAVLVPMEAPKKVDGLFTENNNLQLTIEKVDSAERYAVYQKNGDEYTLLFETEYTTACIENASKDVEYAVTAIGSRGESGMTVVQASDNITLDNILLNKVPVFIQEMSNPQWVHEQYPLKNITDGNPENRNAVQDVAGKWVMEIDLEGEYMLDRMEIKEWTGDDKPTRSYITTIEAQTPAGTWVQVGDKFQLNSGVIVGHDMNKTRATKLRFTFDNNNQVQKSACISEITCTAVAPETADKSALFRELQKISGTDFSKYVLDPVVRELEQLQEEGMAVLADAAATQAQVDTIAEKMSAAIEKFNKIGKNIFLNQKVVVDPKADERFPAEYMTDGDSETRYSRIWMQNSVNTVTATVTLDGVYRIDSLYIQEFLEQNDNYVTRCGGTTIEVLSNGVWIPVVESQSLKSEPDQNGKPQSTNKLELAQPIVGNAVRFTMTNTQNDKTPTIFELQAAGEKLDWSRLNAAITKAQSKVESEYTPSSWNALKTALEAAEQFKITGNPTQEEITAMAVELETAINGLVQKADKTDLGKVIAEAGSLTENSYTADSWNAMQKELAKAKTVNDNADATQAEVDAAKTALQAAIDALVKKPGERTGEDSGSGSGDNNNGNTGNGNAGNGNAGDNTQSSDSNAAQTGDNSPIGFWIGMAAVVAALFAIVLKKRKRA